jgi:hypothetical protein
MLSTIIVNDLTLASCAYCSSAILPHDCFYSNHTSPCALHDTSSVIMSSYMINRSFSWELTPVAPDSGVV